MNYPLDDYPLEEMERKSVPRLVKDILDLDQLLKRLDKIPLTSEEEKEEWRRKEKEKERVKGWEKRLKESGVPLAFYQACVQKKIVQCKLFPGMNQVKARSWFFASSKKGKTFSACNLIAKELWEGRRGLYLKAVDLERELSSFRPQEELLRKYQRVPFLVVDDFEGMRMSVNSSCNFIAFLKKRNDSGLCSFIIMRERTFFAEQIERATT